MSDRTLRGLHVLAYEGTDELRAFPGAKLSTDLEMAEMLAEHENNVNSQAATMGGPTRPRVVVVEVLLPCRVVKG